MKPDNESRIKLLEGLYQAVCVGVECVDALNGDKLDLVERVEAKARMNAAWAEIRQIIKQIEERG